MKEATKLLLILVPRAKRMTPMKRHNYIKVMQGDSCQF